MSPNRNQFLSQRHCQTFADPIPNPSTTTHNHHPSLSHRLRHAIANFFSGPHSPRLPTHSRPATTATMKIPQGVRHQARHQDFLGSNSPNAPADPGTSSQAHYP
ncbi:PREDICTED: uncharacterized protein LOC109225121 [Nicotiana attenuata]|uniref:uncharacterized protein LOC109225121 n=1 Tax=Nicotiana attenuata TaxID=49451 RepID=UPI000905580F|nr:PREDICTED: uncharacterized protein LOC109225121 [Nicotiana attenuata]